MTFYHSDDIRANPELIVDSRIIGIAKSVLNTEPINEVQVITDSEQYKEALQRMADKIDQDIINSIPSE